MKFSIIYEFDVPMSVSVKSCQPSNLRNWQLTEQSDGQPSDWCSDIFDGKVKHRKLCAVLDKDQFVDFVNSVGLVAARCKTMGSLGAPGCGPGFAPAVAFRSDAQDAIQSAYVTPLPCKPSGEPIRPAGCTERDFDRIEQAMWRQFS